MASSKFFDNIPPFPDDVPITPLYTISLTELRANDPAAARLIFKAAHELGFFLLDLRGDIVGDAFIQDIDQLFAAGVDIFNLPDDVKKAYEHDAPRSFLGFKPLGQARTETSQPDRFEWLNVGQDPLLGTTTPPQPLPPLVTSQLPLFNSFLQHGQTIATTISSTLATELGLPATAFTSLQRMNKPSGTVMRLIKAMRSPENEALRTAMTHHTDFGTITLLANIIGGLQILAPGAKADDPNGWSWVKPRPGHLIVNLGDAMVQWSGGRLRSNVHRINHAPGAQRTVDRYSLALLMRPEKDASMKSLIVTGDPKFDDEQLSAWEWEQRQTMGYLRGDIQIQSKGGRKASE